MNIMKNTMGLLVALVFLFGGAMMTEAQSGVSSGGACGLSEGSESCATGLTCTNFVCTASGTSVSGITGAGTSVTATLQNPIKYDDFYAFVEAVLSVAVEILFPFVVLAFIWSGFLFVRAQGKPEDIEKAKSAILWSIVGAFILLGAWGFAQIIGTTVSTLTE